MLIEGRNTFVITAALICNFINITIDFMLIKYGKQGMKSAGIAILHVLEF
ncbi:hypothetical protein IJQ19_02330 [bacterium]|nr:hypothetical protein [bacterium]